MRTMLLSVLLLAAPLAAQSIETVNGIAIPLVDPGDAVVVSIGTQLSIHGSGFAGLTGTAMPKVFTSSVTVPKKRALKVISFTDTDIVAEIRSGAVGTYDLTVQPKGKGLVPLVASGIVRILTPVFDAPNPSIAGPGTLVTLDGSWGPETFGNKIGKVKVGGKVAKIVDWQKGAVVFEMPAKLADGLYVVEVTNKVQTSTVINSVPGAPFCLQMDGSVFDLGGPDRFSCKVGSKKYKASGDFLSIIAYYDDSSMVPFVGIVATIQEGIPQRSMSVNIPVNLTTATFPMIIHGSADGKVEMALLNDIFGLDKTTWSTVHADPDANDWVIVLNGWEDNAETGGKQLSGSFSAQLLRVEGTVNPENVNVSLGDFRVTVDTM